jgi:hypothetical protein
MQTDLNISNAGPRSDVYTNCFICVSGVRWDALPPEDALPWRLLHRPRVVYIEEPLAVQTPQLKPHLETLPQTQAGAVDVTVLRLRYPAHDGKKAAGYGDSVIQPVYNTLVLRYLQQAGIENPILWIGDIRALDFARVIPHQLLICDMLNCQPSQAKVAVQWMNQWNTIVRKPLPQ